MSETLSFDRLLSLACGLAEVQNLRESYLGCWRAAESPESHTKQASSPFGMVRTDEHVNAGSSEAEQGSSALIQWPDLAKLHMPMLEVFPQHGKEMAVLHGSKI